MGAENLCPEFIALHSVFTLLGCIGRMGGDDHFLTSDTESVS
jgi:hypothetical protein